MPEIYITKSDGSKQLYSDVKLRKSLLGSGATKEVAEDIVSHIKNELIEGMSSDRIYKHAFSLLKKNQRPVAAKYSLKRAVAEFGPSGFPFEKFIAEIFRAMGYKAKTGQTLKGACITHEVDVIAENENEFVFVEAKFHNQVGTKSDAKVPMYVKSRIDDLEKTHYGGLKHKGLRSDPWIITNTKFTKSALEFGACSGINMVDWSSPKGRCLRDLIEDADLHPVTAITGLSKTEKEALLRQNIVLARDLLQKTSVLQALGIRKFKIEQILKEVIEIIRK